MVVHLAVTVVVVALVGGWNGGEREGDKKNCRNGAERLVFGRLWTQFSPPSGNQIRLYLYKVEEGNLFYTGVKFKQLIGLVRIPTVGSK